MASLRLPFAPPTLGITQFVLFVRVCFYKAQWKWWALWDGERRAARQVLSQKSNILIYFSVCNIWSFFILWPLVLYRKSISLKIHERKPGLGGGKCIVQSPEQVEAWAANAILMSRSPTVCYAPLHCKVEVSYNGKTRSWKKSWLQRFYLFKQRLCDSRILSPFICYKPPPPPPLWNMNFGVIHQEKGRQNLDPLTSVELCNLYLLSIWL